MANMAALTAKTKECLEQGHTCIITGPTASSVARTHAGIIANCRQALQNRAPVSNILHVAILHDY